MQNKELKNTSLRKCPFCGGEAEIIHESVGRWYVRCKKCWCKTKVNTSEMFAIGDWNTRKPMVKLVDKLDQAAFSVPDEDEDEDLWVVDLHKAIDLVKGVQNE